jgi:3-oxoacyl-[acyl-carrier-protein] synthase III
MRFSRVIGTGSYLPETVISNDELARRLDTSDEWIRSRTGIRERHVAAPGQSATDLAEAAALAALRSAGLDAKALDLIIVATSTPEFIFPSTACLLQGRLGASGGAAFDVQAVCSGFVYGLATADAYIRSGMASTALVVGSEVFSRILDWNDRGTCVLFGDGAGAVVLRADAQPGIEATALHADGSQAGILNVPGNVCGGKILGSPYLHMDGQAVFKQAVRVLEEVGREVLQKAGLGVESIDWFIPHQANIRIIEATGRKLGIPPEKVLITVDRHANTSAASIPLALDDGVRAGRVREGQRVLVEGVGGGFTWGAALIRL